MNMKEFFGKFASLYLWGNLLAMALVVAAVLFGVQFGLKQYTHHGEGVKVPNLVNMYHNDAIVLAETDGLRIVVSDSGYNKKLPAHCILAQTPGYGTYVKAGHVIYVTVNSPSSPAFPIPDLIDNSSYREAEAKLLAMGFRVLPPKRIPGEKDWVYGIISRGRRVGTGDMESIDAPLTLIIGSGMYGDDDDIDYDFVESEAPVDNGGGESDDFEEVEEELVE